MYIQIDSPILLTTLPVFSLDISIFTCRRTFLLSYFPTLLLKSLFLGKILWKRDLIKGNNS